MSLKRCRLVVLLAVVVLLSTVATAQDANTTAPCPSAVQSALSSPLYATCQQDVATFRDTGAWPAWVFTISEKDAIHGSEACMTTLMDLQRAVASGACLTTVSGARDGTAVHVTVARTALDQVATACRRLRRLRTAADASSPQNATQPLA